MDSGRAVTGGTPQSPGHFQDELRRATVCHGSEGFAVTVKRPPALLAPLGDGLEGEGREAFPVEEQYRVAVVEL